MRLLIKSGLLLIGLLFTSIILVRGFAQNSLSGAMIKQFRISAHENLGTTFQAPVSGLYVFEYNAGGFLTYNPPRGGCNRSDSPCYSSFLVAFAGDQVRWSGQDLDFSRTLFRLGEDGAAWSIAEAEEKTAGQRVSASLNQNEQVTFVVGDLRTAYDDNSGEIILNIYFVPT